MPIAPLPLPAMPRVQDGTTLCRHCLSVIEDKDWSRHVGRCEPPLAPAPRSVAVGAAGPSTAPAAAPSRLFPQADPMQQEVEDDVLQPESREEDHVPPTAPASPVVATAAASRHRGIAPLGPSPMELRARRMRGLLADARRASAVPVVTRRDLHWLRMIVEDGWSATKVGERLAEEHFVRAHPATCIP